nr:hypothetical protein MmNV_64 [Menippe mercenaria nudivirus]
MYSIYFGDAQGNVANNNMDNLECKSTYEYTTNLIKPYVKRNDYHIGDVIMGSDFIICITFEDINLIETAFSWSTYISSVCELLNWNKSKLVQVHTNNNNTLFPHTSITALHSDLCVLIENLSKNFASVELC